MSLKELKSSLEQHGIHLTKKRGQNFLLDENLISWLIKKTNITSEDVILEVGTGYGALTQLLIETGARIYSFEIDKKIYEVAAKRFWSVPNLTLFHEDFLKSSNLSDIPTPFRVIANIPYNISTQILIKLWFLKSRIIDIHLLVQKEVGERLSAQKGKETGFLSVLLQSDFSLKILKTVPPESFFPKPSVDSVYLKLTPIDSIVPEAEKPYFFQLVKEGFSQRRKKLLTKLNKTYNHAELAFHKNDISENIRAEQLTPAQWGHLWNVLKNQKK